MKQDHSKNRLPMYAAVATTIPFTSMGTSVKADVFTQTGLSHRWGLAAGQTGSTFFSFNITGAGGTVAGQAAGRGYADAGNDQYNRTNMYLAFGITNASFRGIRQQGQGFSIQGGLPVESGATWDNVGRTTGEFSGTNVSFSTNTSARLNMPGLVFPSGPGGNPQGLGMGSDGEESSSWAILFKFTSGAAAENYGWISFDAYIFDELYQHVTITGWGWDDTGAKIAAPNSATGTMPSNSSSSAVPGVGGLLALAAGCGGMRRRRTR